MNNSVNVIGHDKELIFKKGDIFANISCIKPLLPNDPPIDAEGDFPIDNLPKPMLSTIGANGHKISTRLRIIVGGQTNRSTLSASFGGHIFPPLPDSVGTRGRVPLRYLYLYRMVWWAQCIVPLRSIIDYVSVIADAIYYG